MKAKQLFIVLWAVSIFMIGYSIFIEINKKNDQATIERINSASGKITDYASKNDVLPETLAAAGVQENNIEYKRLSDISYELCGTFKQAEPGSHSTYEDSQVYAYTHKAGRDCFKATPYHLKNLQQSTRKSQSSLFSSPSAVQSKAYDVERETDIKALHAQIEAYYAAKGEYPHFGDLTDATWRAANMKGLDKEAVRDPQGTSYNLTFTPIQNSYSYEAKSATGTQCLSAATICATYTLTAMLSSGEKYTKKALN